MSRRVPAALALALAAALLAVTTDRTGTVALLALPIAVSALSGRRLAVSAPAEVLVALGCGAIGLVVSAALPPGAGLAPEPLRTTWSQLAFAALAFAGLRLCWQRPAFGLSGTFGVGLLVFLACGTVRVGPLYPVLLVGYAVLAFQALRAADVAAGGRPAALGRSRRTRAATGLLLALSVVLGVGFSLGIPRFYRLAYAWALDWVDERHRAGFHDGPMRVGALHALLASDEIVMRVEGDAGERLRGQIYTHYARGRWLPAPDRDARAVRVRVADDEARPGGAVRAVVRHAREGTSRFFVPARPGGLRLAPADVQVDAFGVVRATGDTGAERLVLLDSDERPFPSAAPGRADLVVPEEVAAVAGMLARAWVPLEKAPAERVAAIRSRLEREYTYTLERRPAAGGADPLVSFLLDDPTGHCEYFASAMTVLARAAGVPARLVTGYRVVERNPFGGYAVVRERHAHAWTEVYLEGAGWVGVDPSPLRSTAAGAVAATPWLAGLVDYGIVTGRRHGTELLLVALVAGLAAVQIRRLLRGRTARVRAAAPDFAPPPAWVLGVLARLAEAGLERRPSEPLESLARRARGHALRVPAGSADVAEAALLLRRYTALRYGGEGRLEDLRDDCLRFVERTASGRRAAPRPARPATGAFP